MYLSFPQRLYFTGPCAATYTEPLASPLSSAPTGIHACNVFSYLIPLTDSLISPFIIPGHSPHTFFLINFCWSIVTLQCCVSFYCTKKNESAIHIHISLPFGPLSHSGQHSALSRVLCATKYVLISYLFYA